MKKALPNILALTVLLVGTYFNWNWPWGALFLFWTIPAIYAGEIHLITPVTKKANPALFWTILVTWIALSVFMIASDFIGFS